MSAERLQKIIAQAGLASRRTAEEWIADGLVTVNGATAKLGDKATLGTDAIKVKGKLLQQPAYKVYYLFYKPKHVIAMVNEDEEGRETIKDYTKKIIKERIFTVGRMDYQGEGAILLTNDGDLTQKILKSDHIIRRYHIKVDRIPSNDELQRLGRGGRIEGRSMTPSHVRVVKAYARNALIEISFEGMGTIDVRKFFENKGFFPEKVARVGIGHIKADDMAPGTFRKLEKSSVEALLSQPELAKRIIGKALEGEARRMKAIEEEQVKKQERAEKELRRRGPAAKTKSKP
ncbi:MAG: rRNA pseudouridine synthase [Bdellovibrionales bacterium]|nr:rRNA pseudouridine synthase [Bdellovibrionales bacterium]